MVDLAFCDDFFEQDRSWDDSGTTISGMWSPHQNSEKVRWFLELIIIFVNVYKKSVNTHQKACFFIEVLFV